MTVHFVVHLITIKQGGCRVPAVSGPEMSCACGFEVPVGRSVLEFICPVSRYENLRQSLLTERTTSCASPSIRSPAMRLLNCGESKSLCQS